MLDLELETPPKRTDLKSHLMCTLRPMREEDSVAISKLTLKISQNDQPPFNEPFSDINLNIKQSHYADDIRNRPILALEGEKIVAMGILHRIEEFRKRDVGSLGILIDSNHVNQGLLHLLVRSLVQVAKQLEMIRLESELMSSSPTYDVFRGAGFDEVSRVQDYFETEHGHRQFYDRILLGINLKKSKSACATL